MLSKRLLLKPGFIIILLLIPLSVFALKIGVSGNSSVLSVGLYSEGSEIGDSIVDELLDRDSIINFVKYHSEEDARQALLSEKIDSAWIFPEDIEEKIKRNAKYGTMKPLVKVIERESADSLEMSHELLYGSIHPYVAYSNYTSFIEEKYGQQITPSLEDMEYHYNKGAMSGTLIEIKVLGDEKSETVSKDFLTFPLRGMLSLVIVLCGLASVMYFLSDKKNGRFDWLPSPLHIIPAFGSCFAGILISSFTVFVSLLLLGIDTKIFTEISAMLLYMICVCFFCLICGMLSGTDARLGAFTPFIMIIMLVQCPIFLNMDSARPLWFLLPPSYYLYAVYDSRYLWYMAIYAVVSLIVLIGLNCLSKRRPAKNGN